MRPRALRAGPLEAQEWQWASMRVSPGTLGAGDLLLHAAQETIGVGAGGRPALPERPVVPFRCAVGGVSVRAAHACCFPRAPPEAVPRVRFAPAAFSTEFTRFGAHSRGSIVFMSRIGPEISRAVNISGPRTRARPHMRAFTRLATRLGDRRRGVRLSRAEESPTPDRNPARGSRRGCFGAAGSQPASDPPSHSPPNGAVHTVRSSGPDARRRCGQLRRVPAQPA